MSHWAYITAIMLATNSVISSPEHSTSLRRFILKRVLIGFTNWVTIDVRKSLIRKYYHILELNWSETSPMTIFLWVFLYLDSIELLVLSIFLVTDHFKITHHVFSLHHVLHHQSIVSMLRWYTYSVPYLTPSPTEVFIMSTAIPNFKFSLSQTELEPCTHTNTLSC